MASIGNALVSKILGHSAAEKAFRPWWDNLEDFLVYGLVMLGKPTNSDKNAYQNNQNLFIFALNLYS